MTEIWSILNLVNFDMLKYKINLNTQILEYLTAIQRGIQPQIKADYQVIFE